MLVDWVISVHYKLRLLPEALFLAVNVIDRTLSMQFIPLRDFQLLGTVGLFIAAKYEEVMPPSIEIFAMCGGDLFGVEEVRLCERRVLRLLAFDLSYPNPMNFLRRISKADDYDMETRTMSKYFLEMGLVDWRLLAHPPSVLAAAAFWLARRILARGRWGPTLIHYSTYTEAELLATAEIMLDYALRQPQPSPRKYGDTSAAPKTQRFRTDTTASVSTSMHQADSPNAAAAAAAVAERHPKFFKKYSSKRFLSVATWARAGVTIDHPHCVRSCSAEPDPHDPIAVDLFAERGYPRPDTKQLMEIFNIPSHDQYARLVEQFKVLNWGVDLPTPFSPPRPPAPSALAPKQLLR